MLLRDMVLSSTSFRVVYRCRDILEVKSVDMVYTGEILAI